MKIRTDLKAGNLIEDISREATQVENVIETWTQNLSSQMQGFGNWTDAQVAQLENTLKNFLRF